MLTSYEDVLEEWKSLYTEEIQNIWKTERKELRRVTMVFHVLKQEFARIETNLSHEMDNFRQKIELIDNLKKSSLPTNPKSPEKSSQINIAEDTELNKSPKLNKWRKSSYLKKPPSPSLLDIPKKNKCGENSIAVPKIRQIESEELFNSSDHDSPLNMYTVEDSSVDNKLDIFKTPQGIKRSANVDVIDSSLIIEDTPNKCTNKPIKWNRKHTSLKGKPSKIVKTKPNKSLTLTQMVDNFPNQKIKVNGTRGDKSRKQIPAVEKTPRIMNADYETFFPLEKENHKDIRNKNMQLKGNVPILDAFFKDYDKIPVLKDTSPQHVHKTEAVRRKADRMKLHGWSCSECEQYYKGLNLPPEELRKKLNACSKHRNKFQLLDVTRKGFWDVTMPDTQETQHSDTTLFNF